MSENRNGFTSKLGVILATVGTAVGLGNIWRFPFILGNNGGGAFLLIYFICLIFLGLPVVLAEFTVGRRAQANAVDAYKKFTKNPIWSKIGYLGVFAGFLIMGYYSVVLGWTAEYLFQAIIGNLQGHSPEAYQQMFSDLSGGTFYPILLVVIVMAVTCFIISRGVQSGIEGVSRYLMPMLFILMLGLVGYSLTLDGAAEGLEFLFYPDFSEVTSRTILDAMGQCFFSLSLGMGCLTTYASYFKKDVNLPNTAVQIITIDTLVAVLAGLMIFPAVFSFGLEPSQGAGLVYVVLPNVFQQMVGGQIFAIMFYALLFIAALTSMISLLEVVTAYVHETFKLNRTLSAVIITVLVIIMAVFASLSCGAMPELALFGKSVFDIFDYVSAVILLPIGGMAISIYAGWILDEKILYVEFSRNNKYAMWLFKAYAFALKYIAPVCIFVVFVASLLNFGSEEPSLKESYQKTTTEIENIDLYSFVDSIKLSDGTVIDLTRVEARKDSIEKYGSMTWYKNDKIIDSDSTLVKVPNDTVIYSASFIQNDLILVTYKESGRDSVIILPKETPILDSLIIN